MPIYPDRACVLSFVVSCNPTTLEYTIIYLEEEPLAPSSESLKKYWNETV